MNISYNWLKRYIATDLPAEKIAEILTDIGLEVEGFEKIETVKGGLRGVVVGEVVTCADHPDSDHLHVTTVDVGAAEPLQIVCGAANCRAGLKVLCATVGAVLYPDGGDECQHTRWEACPDCQARIAAEGLRDETQLQSYLTHRVNARLPDTGRERSRPLPTKHP